MVIAMKALAYDRFGSLDVLHEAELPTPLLTKGHVLVAVRASSVNVIDNRVRNGMMGPLVNKKFPKVPGADLAGIVRQVGEGVTCLKVGDVVFGAVDPFKGGAFAEVAAVPESQLALKPADLSFEAAASLPIAGIAALTSTRDLGQVKAGSKVLVHGGSGAVGLFAIQIAKRLGGHVTAVAGTAGIAAMRDAGADVVIDYSKQDVAATSTGSYDVILNASGALPYAKARALLADAGRLIEPSPNIPLVIGSKVANPFRRRQHLALMAKPSRSDLELLASWVADGTLKPTIAMTLSLSQARDALATMERGGVVGKVIVSPMSTT